MPIWLSGLRARQKSNFMTAGPNGEVFLTPNAQPRKHPEPPDGRRPTPNVQLARAALKRWELDVGRWTFSYFVAIRGQTP